MKKQNPQDERVVAQRRKINSEAYGILIVVLLLSIIVQQYLLNAPFEQYAVEFICFIGMSFFVLVRNMMLGLNLFGDGKRAKAIPFVNSIITGLVVTAINGVFNYIKFAEHYNETSIGYFVAVLAITFVSATVSVFIALSLLNYLNKKRQAKMLKRLDDEDENGE